MIVGRKLFLTYQEVVGTEHLESGDHFIVAEGEAAPLRRLWLPERDGGRGVEVDEHRVCVLVLRGLGDVDVRLVLKQNNYVQF